MRLRRSHRRMQGAPMTSLLDTVRLPELPTVLAPLWRWWIDEIVDLIPAAVRNRYAARAIPSVEIHDDGTVIAHRDRDTATLAPVIDAQPHLTAEPTRPHAPVIAYVEARHVFVTQVTLTMATKKNLTNIVRHELERHSPIDVTKTFYCYRALSSDRARRRQEIELRVIKRDTVDRILQAGSDR